MAKYNVFETTNLAAVKYAERIFDAVAEVDIENGTFGYLDGQLENYAGDVVYKFVAGTKEGLKAGDVVVANNPAWREDVSRMAEQRRDQFVIPAGTIFRVYVVRKNDEFATAIEGFTSATQSVVTDATDFIGSDVYVSIDASTGKLVAATSAPAGAMVGRIMRKRIVGGQLVTPTRTYGASNAMYEVKINAIGE